jgi:hypothetical protein
VPLTRIRSTSPRYDCTNRSVIFRISRFATTSARARRAISAARSGLAIKSRIARANVSGSSASAQISSLPIVQKSSKALVHVFLSYSRCGKKSAGSAAH